MNKKKLNVNIDEAIREIPKRLSTKKIYLRIKFRIQFRSILSIHFSDSVVIIKCKLCAGNEHQSVIFTFITTYRRNWFQVKNIDVRENLIWTFEATWRRLEKPITQKKTLTFMTRNNVDFDRSYMIYRCHDGKLTHYRLFPKKKNYVNSSTKTTRNVYFDSIRIIKNVLGHATRVLLITLKHQIDN